MVMMVMVPMVIVTVVAAILCGNYYINTIHSEVETELKNICALARTALDDLYPGDYTLVGDKEKAILKGDKVLNGDFTVPDRIKDNTDIEFSVFYYDTRILTTIRDDKGERIVGTGANAMVMRDVYENGTPGFFPRVDIMGNDYFAYYEPVKNSDGSIVGMLFAGKRVEDVRETSIIYLLPMILIIIALLVIEGAILVIWTRNTIRHIGTIEDFLVLMSEGKFSRELSPVITGRDDEIGRLGASVVKVQGAIRDLIEKDVLTGLHNRRFGFARLEDTKLLAEKSGVPFCVVMCDIDHFKRFNDTYGHDAGDLVLKEVSKLLKNEMAGKGYTIRWGGEEFLLVFTGSNMESAKAPLENIRNEIKNLRIYYMDVELSVTMSFGMADGNSKALVDTFIKEADERLYYAKEHGRDQIVTMIPWWKEEKPQPEIRKAEFPVISIPVIDKHPKRAAERMMEEPDADVYEQPDEAQPEEDYPDGYPEAHPAKEAQGQHKARRGRPRKIKPERN